MERRGRGQFKLMSQYSAKRVHPAEDWHANRVNFSLRRRHVTTILDGDDDDDDDGSCGVVLHRFDITMP